MQRVPDYQVIVDASGNTSSRLLMDTTPDISLRQFLESLDLDLSGVFGTINLLGGVYSVIPTTPINLPDLVTGVTVDGVEGLPDGGTGEVDIVLDSVREVEILTASGAGTAALVARAVAGTGKKLQITFPEVATADLTGTTRMVFSQFEKWGNSSDPSKPGPAMANGPSTATALSFSTVTGAFVHAGFVGAYTVGAGKFTVPVGEAGWYLFQVSATIDLESFGNTSDNYNWQLDVRDTSTGYIQQYVSNTNNKSSTGLNMYLIQYLEEGAQRAPYFLPSENGLTTLVRLAVSVFKIEV
jgi:hypothetical protein